MEPDNEMLRDRAKARGWQSAEHETWVVSSPDGSGRAVVRAVPEGFEARVWRDQAGLSVGPDPEPSHGPQIFQSCDDALEYAERYLGADGAPPAQ